MMPAALKNFFYALLRTREEGKRAHEALTRLLSALPKTEGRRLLDVGCGEGRKTLLYAKQLGVRTENVRGLDTMKYTEQAGKKFRTDTLDLEKEKFPYPDEFFDVIICNQVVEHLKNFFLPLSEMERTLKTGGAMLIGIPNLAALHNRVLLLFGSQPVSNAIRGPHVRCFTRAAFKDFLRSNEKFKLSGTDAATLYPLPYPLVDIGARIFPALASGAFYSLRKTGRWNGDSAWKPDPDCDTLWQNDETGIVHGGPQA
jgi:SAM-dependent methyltransferase